MTAQPRVLFRRPSRECWEWRLKLIAVKCFGKWNLSIKKFLHSFAARCGNSKSMVYGSGQEMGPRSSTPRKRLDEEFPNLFNCPSPAAKPESLKLRQRSSEEWKIGMAMGDGDKDPAQPINLQCLPYTSTEQRRAGSVFKQFPDNVSRKVQFIMPFRRVK